MDDFDIYEGLDDIAEKPQEPSADDKELSEKLRHVTEQLTEAKRKHENLINLNKTLKYNISTILLTARRELARKDERIKTLTKEKDAIIFRRAGHNSKLEQQTLNHKCTSDKGVQTENENGVQSVIPCHTWNKFTHPEKQVVPSSTMFHKTKVYPKGVQTEVSNKQFQIVRYVGQHNTVYKTETVALLGYIEKRHQSVQTVKNIESSIVNETNNNTKSSVADTDAIESLLALSRGCPKNDGPQKILNDDYEKLLLDRQTILDELSKEDLCITSQSVKNPDKLIKKHDNKKPAQSKDVGKANVDIYDLSPVCQIDKTKPLRQYAGGRGKPNLKQLEILIKDCKSPTSNNNQNNMKIDMEDDTEQMEQFKKSETVIKPMSQQMDKVKKTETENIKHSRKQKFTDIKTNCNLEHIPSDPIETKPRKAYVTKAKSKVTRSRKRRLDSLFDEETEEVVTKRSSRLKAPLVIETLEKASKTSPELPSTKSKTDNQTMSECSNSKPKPMPLEELTYLSPSDNIDNQMKSISADRKVQPSLPVEIIFLPPNNIETQIKLRSDPNLPIPLHDPVELPSLPPNNNITKNDIKEALISNETVGSKDGEEQNSQNNSSVEIKMSTTSYKIETLGDETTVYIRRNKKKKKHSL